VPWKELLQRIIGEFGDIAVPDALMSERTTFRVGGPADALVAPRTRENLQKLLRMIDGSGMPVFIFSGGSNLLVRDGGIRGLVIDMSTGFDDMSVHAMPGGATHLHVGASRTVADVVEECAKRGLAGMEWAAGIPGTVGGGIRGNAGTRDGDFAKTLANVEIVDEKGEYRIVPRDLIPFKYRSMGLPGRFIIVAGMLALQPGDAAKIREAVDRMIKWRYEKQPYEAASAGSIFKNPEHAPAGRLIDQAGCKGARVGQAMVSDVHTNFIVNLGGAQAADIIELIERTRKCVFEKHGIRLETEVVIVGEP
jgi:UDP-N-acetylmuramate dehydrogenase